MPFLRKNTKVSRLSRLMAVFQTPPKRGGPLVVETGFPTSVVDLFVKNRDRLKRRSKKKQQMEISWPMNVTPPPPCYSEPKENSSSGGEENVQREVYMSTPVEELEVFEECVGDDRGVGAGNDDGSKKRRVLMVVLRVIFVVVLAFCSKNLTIGITKSAILLLFLELVGTKYKARTVFDCFVEKVKVFCFCKCRKDGEEAKRFVKDSSMGFCDGSLCDSSVEESEVIDTKCALEIESGDITERGLDLKKKKTILGENEIKNEDRDDGCVSKKEQSRRAKMKANLKKFVSRKLSKKKDKKCKEKEMNSDAEVCYCTVEDKLKEQRNGEEEVLFQSSVKEEESGEGEVIDECQAEAKMIVVEKSAERDGKGNSGYLILCLIVLTGLFGGRILALTLTVCWCLMLKLAGKLRSFTISS